MNRTIEIIISATFLVALSPLILSVLTVSAILTGKFPVIKQARSLTLESDRINVYKIRTIRHLKEFRIAEKNSSKIFNKTEYENFVPLFCAYLRKTGFDEILQLLNVIKGEMSLIGPRPLIKNDLILMRKAEPELYERRRNIKSKPGITGYWQIWGNREEGITNLIELDEYYEKNKSLFLDLKIVLKTLVVFLTAGHVDAILGNKKVTAFISDKKDITKLANTSLLFDNSQ